MNTNPFDEHLSLVESRSQDKFGVLNELMKVCINEWFVD